MSTITLHEGDNRDSLRRLIAQGVRVHSVVCDPPYGLTSVVKRFGKDNAAPALSNGATGVFKRASGGFMGQEWDASGIERDPEFWRLIWEILLPGGYVLAFSGARTGHWQACAMEQAGFIMHPMIGWTYGSGFPKAHNAARAVDQALGVEGRREGVKPGHEEFAGRKTTGHIDFKDATEGFDRPWMKDDAKRADYHKNYVPGAAEAAKWEGWAYGAQSLKPAFEPIYMGQKPFSEKNGALNLLKHGVGAVNIDGCRVAADDGSNRGRPPRTENAIYGGGKGTNLAASEHNSLGRHPANLLHDGSPEVVALFPDSKGQAGAVKGTEPSAKTDNCYGDFAGRAPSEPRGDSGSAARFFNSFPEPDPQPLYYHAKAAKSDRAGSKHPTVKPVKLMEWLVTLVTPPGGTVLDPFGGSGTTGQAAKNLGFDCILMEAEAAYIADIKTRFGLPSNDDCDLFGAEPAFDDLFG